MASLADSPEDLEVENALKMKAEFMIFLSVSSTALNLDFEQILRFIV
jgi:hypothetical protein